MHQPCQFMVVQVVLASLALVGCRHRREPPPPVVYEERRDYAEPRRVVWTINPRVSSKVPAGELVGVVVDEQNGEPLARARVTATDKYYNAGANSSVETDSAGRFRVTVPREAAAVRVEHTQRPPTFLPLDWNRDSGLVAVVALQRPVILPCMVVVSTLSLPGVDIRARDAMTGAGPLVPVTITVSSGTFRDSLVVNVDSLGRVSRDIAPDRPGFYHVTVRALGYRDWTGAAATRPRPGCAGQFIPAIFHAWLTPR